MKDDLCIGSAPAEERCAQIESDGYEFRAWHECRALIDQIRRMFGPEPPGSNLYIKRNPHDFGTYFTVNCSFSAEDKIGIEYAFRLERELPAEWDKDAKAYLALKLEPQKPAPKRRKPQTGKAGGGAA